MQRIVVAADGNASQVEFGGLELREVNAGRLACPRAWAIYSSLMVLRSGRYLKPARDISCGRASWRQLCHSQPAAAGKEVSTLTGATCAMKT